MSPEACAPARVVEQGGVSGAQGAGTHRDHAGARRNVIYPVAEDIRLVGRRAGFTPHGGIRPHRGTDPGVAGRHHDSGRDVDHAGARAARLRLPERGRRTPPDLGALGLPGAGVLAANSWDGAVRCLQAATRGALCMCTGARTSWSRTAGCRSTCSRTRPRRWGACSRPRGASTGWGCPATRWPPIRS